MEAVEVTIREAIPADAAKLLAVSQKIAAETEFLIMDEAGLALSTEDLAEQLAYLYDTPNNVVFVAFVAERLVGVASVKASAEYRVAHIGEIGVSILQDYWGYGLGTALLEEIIFWAKENPLIYRLELTVQEQNQRAVKLYKKLGFQTEAHMERGARGDNGDFLTVDLMSLLID